MKFYKIFLFLCTLLITVTANGQNKKVFPYNYQIDDLPNGLRLITVQTDYPNLVSLYIAVGAGSRNEVENGKSGYAHFFEHLMFRGSENFGPGKFDEIMQSAGASNNAYTSDDRTVYHETFAAEDLEQIVKLEADRFQRLKFTEEQFKTESGAVLGEYNKNSASPFFKMYEVARETAFKKHTYSHTTMGYIKDIQDYPNQFDYAWKFWNRFYRPENTTILIVGKIKPADMVTMVKRYWSDWKQGDYKPQITAEPAQTEARTAHLDWDSPVPPHLVVAYRAPAYSDTAKDKAALDLFAAIAFGENSDIFQKLVLEEQKADFVSPDFENKVDPELFWIYSRIKRDDDLDYVKSQIIANIKRYQTELISQKQLDETRSRARYGFAMAMNSNNAIADGIAPYIALRRTPDTIEKVFGLFDSITPEDIRTAVNKYLKETNQTVVTLTAKKGGAK